MKRMSLPMIPRAFAAAGIALGVMSAAEAQSGDQPSFRSPEAAAQALFNAVNRNEETAIRGILGGPSDLASSRDPAQDAADRRLFVDKYEQMNRWGRDPDGLLTLFIGAENWPFPIPLESRDGKWHFDPEAGTNEVLSRRVGDNEIMAIVTCHDLVSATKRHSGKAAAAESSDASLVTVAAQAAGGGASAAPVLVQGYYFRLIPDGGKNPRRFAWIAYPAEYRASGVKTFVVTEKDIVYEKDLGADTVTAAAAMSGFHRDGSWHAAE